MASLKTFFKKHHFLIFTILILMIGCFLRLYQIDVSPAGLNQDEASIGYEAYALAHYGTDRNGNSFPVHFVAWGSGQNALYAYLIAPLTFFIQNDALAIRLPMAIVGCLTLVICAIFIKNFYKNKFGLLALFILAVFPWHIMKSRWGLESNLLPDLICWGMIALLYGIKRHKHRYFILSSILLGLSTYAYGPAYLFVPIVLLVTYGYYVHQKQIKPLPALLYIGLAGLVALPMLIFVVINYFGLDTIHIFKITIPKLDFNRFTEDTSVNGNFIKNSLLNLYHSSKIILFQEDDRILNYIPYFGIYYLFALPFMLYGFILIIKKFKSSPLYQLTIFNLLAGLPVCAMAGANINRINVIWIPLQIVIIIGVIGAVKNKKSFYWAATATYSLSATSFAAYYFITYPSLVDNTNFVSLPEAISVATRSQYQNLYITEKVNQPYIYYLLASKIPPADYIAGRDIPEYHTMFQQVRSIGNTYFHIPSGIATGNTYVMPNSAITSSDLPSSCQVSEFLNYSVVDCTPQSSHN